MLPVSHGSNFRPLHLASAPSCLILFCSRGALQNGLRARRSSQSIKEKTHDLRSHGCGGRRDCCCRCDPCRDDLWLEYYLDAIGIHRSLRDVAIALWSFLLPSWFTVEEAWFAPKDGAELNDFRELQRKARLTWTIADGAVGILIGATAPSGPSQNYTTYDPSISVPSKAGAGRN